MKNLTFFFLFIFNFCFSQNIAEKLNTATQNFLKSPSMYSGNLSFFVSDENGNLIYEYQGNKGLTTASTQKIFTAITALDLLGKDYTYTTTASYQGEIKNNELIGNLIISSNGDPTLGSWRYPGYEPENFRKKLMDAVQKLNIKKITGNIIIDDSYFDFQTIPGGWPWNDLGNYYGAGVWGVNWRENQFDIHIEGGSAIGTSTKFKSFSYPLESVKWVNQTQSAGAQTGDRSLIFTAPHSEVALINGTLPMGKTTTVSGATPNPPIQLGVEVEKWLIDSGIELNGNLTSYSKELIQDKKINLNGKKDFFTYQSPKLEKIVYWFMRKSVNLYGETFLKTLAKSKKNNSSFDVGIQVLKDFWVGKGIHPSMINFADGSGLSPQNYVSARAEVQALLWAQKQKWYDVFYDSFPTYNNMRMKSGTIKDSKGYTGYHISTTGKKYVFSILVNNHSSSDINGELFKILNILK